LAPQAIVVMGVCGVGKSAVGALLAERLGAPFLEGDSFHPGANIAKMRAGVPLTDEDRWPWLDRLGRALGAAARQPPGLAVAACSALRRAYRARLQAAAGLPLRIVCLTGPRELIAARMAGRTGHYMPVSLLDSQLATIELPDAGEDALLLPVEPPVPALVEAALAWLRTPAPPAAATASVVER
jgi:gluconokinase